MTSANLKLYELVTMITCQHNAPICQVRDQRVHIRQMYGM